MNYNVNGFEARDFTQCDKELLLEILRIRNDPQVAQWMYSQNISQNAHFGFVGGLLKEQSERYFVILKDEQIYGVGSLTRLHITHKHGHLGIYTNKSLKVPNKGKQILKIIEHIAFVEFGLHSIFLEVMSENVRALKFYEKYGYEECGFLRDYVYRDSHYCDVVVMSKKNPAEAKEQDALKSLATSTSDCHASDCLPHPLIVAELSANHGGSLAVAKDSLRAIAKSGADAVKLQTYTPDCLTLDCDNEYFRIKGTLWDNMNLYELYKQAQTPFSWHKELFALGRELGLVVFSSPFSAKGVEFLESLGCPMYKIASFEVLDLELIECVAKCGKPVILSAGIASDDELGEAVEICKSNGVRDITLLLCTSSYPASLESLELHKMPLLGKKFGVKFGLSDHTIGTLAPTLATALGASMIEKHFILDSAIKSADSAFSLDSNGFSELVEQVRHAKIALGNAPYKDNAINNVSTAPKSNTQKRGREFARSIWVAKDIKKGEVFSRENIKVLRPNGEIHPREYKHILGKKAAKDLVFGTPLRHENIQKWVKTCAFEVKNL